MPARLAIAPPRDIPCRLDSQPQRATANVLFSNELARATDLYGTNGVAKRELEQAASDARTAEGAPKAACDAVRVLGKTKAEIDQMVAARKIDPALVVPNPVSGPITSRNAQPGQLVRPRSILAPYSAADLSTKWMLAHVIETDSPLIHAGQPLRATVMAYPGRLLKRSRADGKADGELPRRLRPALKPRSLLAPTAIKFSISPVLRRACVKSQACRIIRKHSKASVI